MLGLYFTGTDTGVGKTFITAAVTRTLRQQGQAVSVCKPVVTGADAKRWTDCQFALPGDRSPAEDTRLLAEAAGLIDRWDEVTEWSFPDPVAPPVAARRVGVQLEFTKIVAAVRKRCRPEVPMLVEGVGGLLCPMTETESNADLAGELELPLIVITRRSLGTLNHTLLTLEAAQRRGLNVAGVIVNETSAPMGLADETNVEELRRRIEVPILAVVAYQGQNCRGSALVIPGVDWLRLCRSESR